MALHVPDKVVIAGTVALREKFNKAFYAVTDQDGVELGTSYAVITWAEPTYSDSGFTEDSGEITVTEVLDNARARIDFAVSCSNASSNTLLIRLEQDPDGVSGYTPIRGAGNFAAIAGTVDGFHYLELQAGMKFRVQARIVGSTGAVIAALGTQIAIETKAEILE